MTWTGGSLPISLRPLPGEALESWLGAYAQRLHATNSALLDAIGLTGARTAQMAVRLAAHEADALHHATGISRPVLTAMTLDPYDRLAVTIHPDRRRLVRPPAWRFSAARTRYCPACLAQNAGRGPVFWRLPWAFACPTHHILLRDVCPDCHRPPHPWTARRLGPPAVGVCTRDNLTSRKDHTGRRPCGADLSRAPALPLPETGLVLPAQRHILTLLAGDARARPMALAELKQHYALAWRVLRGLHTVADQAPDVVRTALAECGGALPQLTGEDIGHDAHNAALGTALAHVALHPGHRDHNALFDWILEADQSLQKGPRATIGRRARRWSWSGPALVERALARLDSQATLQARLRYASASPRPRWPTLHADTIVQRAALIPSMLWPGWTMRLLPRLKDTGKLRVGAFRRGCSSFLLLPGGPPELNFARVGPLLDNHQIHTDRDSVERRLYRDRDLTPLASTLAQLAYALDTHGAPIDYARRRATFTHAGLTFDQHAFKRLCAQHGLSTGQHHRAALLRWYLLMLLTGEMHPPPHGASPRFAWHCTEFRFRAPPALRAFLRRQAQDNLARHRIDEPLTWEPPDSWVTGVTWPGTSPTDLDPSGVRDLLSTVTSVNEAGDALGLTTEHIRLYCDLTDISTTTPSNAIGNLSNQLTPRAAEVRRGILAPEQLRDLYTHQQLELAHIARMASCSPDTVRALLIHDNIPLRPQAGRLPPRPDITRVWLHREYVQRRRTMAALARERRVSHYHLTHLAREWDLPIRSTERRYNAIGHLTLPWTPSPAIQAVTASPTALDRLRTLIQVPGHPSIAAAARAIYNARDSALRQRITKIEKAAGFQIIDRSTNPLTPTKPGRAFLQEATQILEAAEETDTRP
ncbi:TniQ family protein [Streptomyces sp. NBC_00124]|uniref:TniQ family protein n=1 Tax=Streptomyces sp. NBC_00124 TaxID=2975662 RepID=UPI0022550C4D|nr:TniQ family protein [Streptomyces sp. NBC_00124]MCX5357257.1 TniQ family protein [Streptomyces sp. NBC_00124]